MPEEFFVTRGIWNFPVSRAWVEGRQVHHKRKAKARLHRKRLRNRKRR